jgi:hypothetical protein
VEFIAEAGAELRVFPHSTEPEPDGRSGSSVLLWVVDIGCIDLTRTEPERSSDIELLVLVHAIQ